MLFHEKHLTDEVIIKKLAQKEIGYFSFAIFNNREPIATYCNTKQWSNIYNNEYNKDKPPPVQKYILNSKAQVIMWDLIDLDKESTKFIDTRNDVVKVTKNVTLLFKRELKIISMTLGTKKDQTYLQDFLNNNMDYISLICRYLTEMYGPISNRPVPCNFCGK
jgi:hypothetical protein